MKKVIGNKELKQKMKEAINLLCDTVKITLGPKGNNIIIDHSTFTPFITNDGVTIAMNIESDDEVINTILEIAKEASIKTNENVGDGTTTTLVLLQKIFNGGIKQIEEGKNPIILKKELDEHIVYLKKYINEKSIKPKQKDLYNITTTSSNSKELGTLITKAYLKIKNIDAISIKENDTQESKIILKKGYTIETLIPSQYFFKDKNEIKINDSNLLIINNYLNDIEDISQILNYIIKNNKELLIIAEDYSESFVNQILNLYLNENINIYLLKIPEYGKNKIDTLNDLSLITNSKIIEDLSFAKETILGISKEIKIDREQTTIIVEENKKIKEKINELKKLRNTKDIDMNFVNKRISMLQKGLIEVSLGATTQIERREKRMRCEDALCALKTSLKGIVPGSGIIFYELSDKLPKINESTLILKNALKEPFNQIMYNSVLNEKEIINKIKENSYNIIFNINTNTYEEINKTNVIDSTEVIINSIINSISIASMLLTTTSIIINECKNEFNKNNSFLEL